jgi:hypothetical protein
MHPDQNGSDTERDSENASSRPVKPKSIHV